MTFSCRPTGPAELVLHNIASLGGEIPGRQTVPRAELWGVIQTISLSSSVTTLYVGVDAKYFTHGVLQRSKLETGANGDLWAILFRMLDDRGHNVGIFKIEAHLDRCGPLALQHGIIRLDDLAGNAFADAVAVRAAHRVRPGQQQCRDAAWTLAFGAKVIKRIAIMQADIWAERKRSRCDL